MAAFGGGDLWEEPLPPPPTLLQRIPWRLVFLIAFVAYVTWRVW